MPTNFVIGQALMLLARREIQSRPRELFTFPLKCALAYSAFIFAPITAWYFYQHMGWSTVYLRPEDTIPRWAGPFIVSQYFAGMLMGGLLAQTLIQLKHQKAVYLTLALGCLWLFGIAGLTINEYLHVGTYFQYHAGTATPLLADHEFQKELNIMGAVMAVPVIFLAVLFVRRSKK